MMESGSVFENLKLEPDDTLPLRDVVFHTLRGAILDGRLQPGTRLMEIQLSTRLGVSRTPVREAIRLLDKEGLVHTSVRRGTLVAPIQEADLRDALEVRKALEMLAARKACRNMDREALCQLEKIEDEFENIRGQGDIRGAADKDALFHSMMVEIAHNRRLSQCLNQINEEIFRYQLEDLKDDATVPRIKKEHRAILEAFRTLNEDAAVEAVRVHIENVADELLARLKD